MMSAQRFANAPRLTDQHIQASSLFYDSHNDPNLHVSAGESCSGDMQFVYNQSVARPHGVHRLADPDETPSFVAALAVMPNDRAA
jgi:hypothetical protein